MEIRKTFEYTEHLASGFQLTHAEVVAVSDKRKGEYQCRVIPHLSGIADITNMPWYPMASPKKLDLIPGDFVWLYVSSDLWVGYILDRFNTESKNINKQEEVFSAITEALASISSDVPHELSYDTCSYQLLSTSTYMVWDTTFAGVVDVANGTLVSLSGSDVLISGSNIHVTNKVQIGEGTSPAVRAVDLLDILDEIEEHRHISPVGPVDSAKTADLAPLSSRIAQFRKTMSSTKLNID